MQFEPSFTPLIYGLCVASQAHLKTAPVIVAAFRLNKVNRSWSPQFINVSHQLAEIKQDLRILFSHSSEQRGSSVQRIV
jgi:hypothetical protein